MKQIFNIDIKYTTNIHFTFSVHLFEMEKHNFNKQWKIFVDNITFIKENIPTSTINVSILKDFRYSIDYLEKVKKELEKYNIYVEIARIHSTQNFITPDKSKNINNHYLKTRYTNRHISISKSFIDDKYYISNQCAMSYYIKPLYDIKVWKSLVENYNNKSECNQNLCLCSYCNQIGYEQD